MVKRYIRPDSSIVYVNLSIIILNNNDEVELKELAIMEDITEKIELICPTNQYSDEFFDETKKSLLVYNRGDFFEPLCKVQKRSTEGRRGYNIEIVKFFSSGDFRVLGGNSNIVNVISKIKSLLEKSCIAKKSLKKYDYERNISARDLISKLKHLDYIDVSQIINFNHKVIGIQIIDGNKYYIPCRPSSISFDKNFIFVQNIEYNDYKTTKDFLTNLYEKSEGKIPCKVESKLIDDNMVVGLKTITNQFVPIYPPVTKVETIDDIREHITYANYKEQNPLLTDQDMLVNNKVDEEREKIIKAIELEYNFYNLFRNTL
jgi:hypothetical protein